MGHYCKICGRERPNEQFSGKGHRKHVCKQCARIPKEQRRVIEVEEEIFGFMAQTHISARNISRLQTLAASPVRRISELATPMLEVVTSFSLFFNERQLTNIIPLCLLGDGFHGE